ncbi:protein PRY2-like [Stylophora pistillata]|uniref:protein PRY2-like n=1 Tax=Stylophora pistillata TaxID=50429 RepID=UPI000C039CE4|nr:protein PRY2-like [Stylophora pistillata]XP_022791760.1 protein PRY2-like [Stylophora pistillata]XP_022791761.1 protein PRY2-like [Stylophora pistillata]
MWICYLLLAITAVDGGQLQRGLQEHLRDVFQNAQSFNLSGSGTANKNGKIDLNLQIQITGVETPTESPTGGAAPLIGAELPGAGGTFTEEEEQGLAKHNEFRQVHGVPAMTLDRQMCDEAKQYAQTLSNMGSLMHSPSSERSGQGENLAMGCSIRAPQTIEEAVTNWYNEVCRPGYDFYIPSFSAGIGHFTQVVWKESIVLGIGIASGKKNGMNCAYIVAIYRPAGNMVGEFTQNVPEGDFNKDSYCATVKRHTLLDKQWKAAFVNNSNATTGSAELRGQFEEQ